MATCHIIMAQRLDSISLSLRCGWQNISWRGSNMDNMELYGTFISLWSLQNTCQHYYPSFKGWLDALNGTSGVKLFFNFIKFYWGRTWYGGKYSNQCVVDTDDKIKHLPKTQSQTNAIYLLFWSQHYFSSDFCLNIMHWHYVLSLIVLHTVL